MIIYKMSRNVIQSQIQSLRTHPHVKKIDIINNRLIQILYYPQDIKSHYAKFQYRIKISLPIKYPEQAPTIKFVDPIDHINIHQKTGQMSMPILSEDWSSYISLYIIVELIDTILVEPQMDTKYCVGSDKAIKYFKDKIIPTKASQNNQSILINFKKYEEFPLFKTSEEVEISAIKIQNSFDKKQMLEEQLKPIGTMKKKLKRLKTMILQKSHGRNDLLQKIPHKESINDRFANQIDKIEEEKSFTMKQQEIQRSREQINRGSDGKQNRGKLRLFHSPDYRQNKVEEEYQKEQNLVPKIDRFKKLQALSISIPESKEKDIKTPKRQKNCTILEQNPHTSKKIVEQKQFHNNPMGSTIYLENNTQSLSKINKVIDLFTKQLQQLQKKKTHMKNQSLLKTIDKKIQQQIQMLQQLQDLSSSVKINMIDNLKMQIKK